jgi:azurin
MKKVATTLLTTALVFIPFAAPAEARPQDQESGGEKAEAKTPDQKIVVEANDLIQFDKKAMEIKAGETIQLTLKHIGKQPKEIMGHNLVVLKKGTDLATWATKAMLARATDYIPADEDAKSKILAHTKLLGGGEEDVITFSIKEPGVYEYLCSFPGHFGVMRGKITVK